MHGCGSSRPEAFWSLPRVCAVDGATSSSRRPGSALILWSACFLSPEWLFPGWNALPAVVGAAFIVNPASAPSLVARMLSFQPLQFAGKISYSLYLWHWPLIVFWRQYRSGAALTLVDAAIVAGAALLIAFASWKWVEQPFRKPLSVKATLRFGLAAAAVVAASMLGVVQENGFPGRVTAKMEALSSLKTMWDWSCPYAPGPFNVDCAVGADWRTAAAGGSSGETATPSIFCLCSISPDERAGVRSRSLATAHPFSTTAV